MYRDIIRTLIIVLLNLGIDRALKGLLDGLGLEVRSAFGAETAFGIHGSLERVTLPYPVISPVTYERPLYSAKRKGVGGQTHSRKRNQHAGPALARQVC